ncbi:unnamed protein product [Rotaria sordida]|uniref:Uncharacterized protein n=1 Tax=Rotaria sordida TaxID=392033 RepID=A0A819ZB97_9BILA|nr:unnamed protein product [Rotaria sordida]CAF4166014.1 unnamed protein product [Rotaria sordida]
MNIFNNCSFIINTFKQNFVDSNNINSLVPDDHQLGTCLHGGGGDAASEHYICTQLNPLTLSLFNVNNEALK